MSRAITVRRTRWWLGYGQWWYAEFEEWEPDWWEEVWLPLGEGKGLASKGKGKGKGRPAAEGKGNATGSASAVAWGNSNRQNQQWAQWAELVQAGAPRLRWAGAVTDDWAPAKRQRTTTEWLRPQSQAASSTDDWYAEDGGDVTQTECQRLAQLREDAKRGRRARSLANNLAHRLTCVPAITMQQLEDHIFDWAIFPEDSDSDPEDYLDDDDPGPPVLGAEHDGAGLVERPQPDDEPAP